MIGWRGKFVNGGWLDRPPNRSVVKCTAEAPAGR